MKFNIPVNKEMDVIKVVRFHDGKLVSPLPSYLFGMNSRWTVQYGLNHKTYPKYKNSLLYAGNDIAEIMANISWLGFPFKARAFVVYEKPIRVVLMDDSMESFWKSGTAGKYSFMTGLPGFACKWIELKELCPIDEIVKAYVNPNSTGYFMKEYKKNYRELKKFLERKE